MKLDFYTVVWFFRACPSPTFCWVPHDDSIPQQLLPTQALHAALTSQTLPHTVIRPCRSWEASFVITFTSALWVAIKSHVVPGHSVMSLWALHHISTSFQGGGPPPRADHLVKFVFNLPSKWIPLGLQAPCGQGLGSAHWLVFPALSRVHSKHSLYIYSMTDWLSEWMENSHRELLQP